MLNLIKPLIVSGPSGCGKTTLISKLLSLYPKNFELSISHTTRSPRPKEKDGFHYYFIMKEKFEEMIANQEFLEFEDVHGKYYGTSKNEITRILNKSIIPVLDIDIKGAINIHSKELSANYLFITTKNIKCLKERLVKRGTETEETLKVRIFNAEKEINLAKSSKIYKEEDYVYNENLKDSEEAFLNKIKTLYKIK